MDIDEKLIEFENDLERRELLERQDALLAISAILNTDEGLKFFKYMYKTLEVAQLPPEGMEGNNLYEFLGFLRAGNSIYKLVSEADFKKSGELIAKIEKEKYDELYRRHQLTNGYYSDNDSE